MQQRLEMGTLLTNAASSARTRFGIHLEHSCSDDEVEVVDMWLALLRRPMLVHPVEATACDISTWLDPLFTVDDIYAFELVESSSAAVTQHLLSMIPAVAVTTTAGFTGSLCHANATTTDNQMSQPRTASSVDGAGVDLGSKAAASPLPPPLSSPPSSLHPPSLSPRRLLSMSGRSAVAEPDEADVMDDCIFGGAGPPPLDHPRPLPPPEPPPRAPRLSESPLQADGGPARPPPLP